MIYRQKTSQCSGANTPWDEGLANLLYGFGIGITNHKGWSLDGHGMLFGCFGRFGDGLWMIFDSVGRLFGSLYGFSMIVS